MQKILDFYLSSSVHVALAVISLCLVTYINFDIHPDKELLWFVFFGTITGYNFVKYAGVAGLHHRSLAKSLRIIQVFSLLCFVLLFYTCFLVDPKILLWTGLFGICTLLYALPVLSGKKNLRSVGSIKIFIISFVWTGVTVLLPAVQAGLAVDWPVALEVLQRFFLVITWILPFEIRDLPFDQKSLRTVPQVLGLTGTRIFGSVLLVQVLLVEFFAPAPGGSELAFIGMFCCTAAALWGAQVKQNTYYTSFWVEGIPILWLSLLFLF